MFLMLHITCSCIFHAYAPSFLYILILNCLVLFYLSFSISLSFISWSMAPPRNPLCSETSSSSSPFNSTPSHIRFYDDKTYKDFSKNFSWWGIHSECQVVLSDFSNTDLPTIIYSRGWESLCDHTGIRYFSTSLCHLHSRYAHRSHSGYCIRGATCS